MSATLISPNMRLQPPPGRHARKNSDSESSPPNSSRGGNRDAGKAGPGLQPVYGDGAQGEQSGEKWM